MDDELAVFAIDASADNKFERLGIKDSVCVIVSFCDENDLGEDKAGQIRLTLGMWPAS